MLRSTKLFAVLFMALGIQALALAELTPTQANPSSLQVVALATNLDFPWGLAFLPDGGMLVTERRGQLRMIDAQSRLGAPIKGVPEVAARGQGGLLDVALSPAFEKDRLVYLSYAEAGDGKMGTAVGRGRLSKNFEALENFEVIFRQMPKLSTGKHFGSRLVFDREGYLFVSLGENNERATAQDLDKHQGEIVRLHADGAVPKDNPFVDRKAARPEIWSYGQRNPQGLALHPATGKVWSSEHGPRGGDEVNLAEPGKNYGWPLATHGINYSGMRFPEAKGETLVGTEPPLYVWKKSPAISGMAFYTGTAPAWKNSVFFGALSSQDVIRLTLDGETVVAEERLLADRGERVRDVRVGPDGALYVLTDAADGKVLRVTPR